MADNPLHQLNQCGQSVWLDSIMRRWLDDGTLQGLIDRDGISGVTANPTIFEKAIASHDYDEEIRRLGREGRSAMQIYETVAVEDVTRATDLFRPTFDRLNGADGFVSLEVSPDIAHDTEASIEEARRFWGEVNRPNLFIKIPATPEGVPAIEQLLYEGINVNITLLFAVEVYEQVMEAFLRGLERRVEEGKPIDTIASVASFFVSRVDTLVDGLLDQKAKDTGSGEQRQTMENLRGKAAVANAKIAYQCYERVFGSERFAALKEKGAQIQRPLWASTSTKNPSYPDTMYVDPLVGEHTVNTMPMETIDAMRDHGKVTCGTVRQGLDEAHQTMQDLAEAGIDMTMVTDQLIKEGVDKFCASLHSLLQTIEQMQGALTGTS